MIRGFNSMSLSWVTCLALALGLPSTSSAQETLYAAAGVKLPIIELAKAYEKQSNRKVELDFDTAGAAEKKFLANPQATVLITTLDRIQKNVAPMKQGNLSPLADTVAGIAMWSTTKPDLKTSEDLKKTLLNVKSIAFSDPSRGATVGTHFLKVIRELGIEKEVMAKATLARDGVETMRLVQSKQVELGITQISEIVQADASLLLGAFPDPYDLSTRYALWSGNNSETKEFVKFLRTEEAQLIYKKHGLRPFQ
jgi:molybdate transport system substrate-binding protein